MTRASSHRSFVPATATPERRLSGTSARLAGRVQWGTIQGKTYAWSMTITPTSAASASECQKT